MSKFLQLHILTPYPPSNPNRDDLGRPKTAMLGGTTRQRISSQAIKRAIRTSEVFESSLEKGTVGIRTRRFGSKIILPSLNETGIEEEKALEITTAIVEAIASVDGREKDVAAANQIVFLSEYELGRATELATSWANGTAELPTLTKGKKTVPDLKRIASEILQNSTTAADIAMFGRMLTGTDNVAARFGLDAAVQISHALTTNAVAIEDDYYTAVDDLKTREEDPEADAGAGFIGEAGFGAGVFYLYICVDRALLLKNLGGDTDLAQKSLEALVRAAATASPSGKRNSFANHVRAEFILAEKGDAQPRTLANAFLTPVGKGDQTALSADALKRKRDAFARVYGQDWSEEILLQLGHDDSATLDEVAAFAGAGLA